MQPLLKMRYKNFSFTQNPAVIKVISDSIQTVHPVYCGTPVVGGVCRKPTIISGSGSLFGKAAVESALLLHRLSMCLDSGWLFVPCAAPMSAFFTAFSYECNAQKDCVLYTFSFTEDCSARRPEYAFGYTLAEEGENAFDIANRMGVSVDAIMERNCLLSPFAVQCGDKVVLP